MVRIPPILSDLSIISQSILNFILTVIKSVSSKSDSPSNIYLPDFNTIYVVAIIITLLIIIIQLLVMLVSIRRDLLQAFRSCYTEIPSPGVASNVIHMTGNFRFAGTLIAYVVLAYILLGFFIFVFISTIAILITNGGFKPFEDMLKLTIPVTLLVLLKIYINKVLSQYVFLQHEFNVLALNNRRIFMIFLYFNIFLDAFLGLVAAFSRIFKSIIGGIIYMCRLDYSPLGRKLETSDVGFSAYCGFIHVECAHRHPVLLFFMSQLLRDHLYKTDSIKWSIARRKWYYAVFLINNPTLIYRRKRFRNRTSSNHLKLALFSRRDHAGNITTDCKNENNKDNEIKRSVERF